MRGISCVIRRLSSNGSERSLPGAKKKTIQPAPNITSFYLRIVQLSASGTSTATTESEMGNVRSLLSRPVKKYNVDGRAEKVISREKPFAAPMHKASKKQLEVARSVSPNFIKEQYRKDAQLDERLKNVYVKSEDPLVPDVESNPDRPLPILTRVPESFEYGFWEPEHTSPGRCSLRTILAFISDYSEDPLKNSPENIARKYKLDVKDVVNILEYFRVFKVIVPEDQASIAYMEQMILPPVQKKD